jgi:hypothetical protein
MYLATADLETGLPLYSLFIAPRVSADRLALATGPSASLFLELRLAVFFVPSSLFPRPFARRTYSLSLHLDVAAHLISRIMNGEGRINSTAMSLITEICNWHVQIS